MDENEPVVLGKLSYLYVPTLPLAPAPCITLSVKLGKLNVHIKRIKIVWQYSEVLCFRSIT